MKEKKNPGCLQNILALIVLTAIIFVVVRMCSAPSPNAQARQTAKDRQIDSTSTVDPSPAPEPTIEPAELDPCTADWASLKLGSQDLAEGVVSAHLLAPSTAKHLRSLYHIERYKPVYDEHGEKVTLVTVHGSTDSQNAFGTVVRVDWLVDIACQNGELQVARIVVAGEETYLLEGYRELIASSSENLKRKQIREIRNEYLILIESARSRAADIEAELADFERSNLRIDEYLDVAQQLKLLRSYGDLDDLPEIQRRIAELEAVLDEIGEISEEELEAYEFARMDLVSRLREQNENIRELEREMENAIEQVESSAQ